MISIHRSSLLLDIGLPHRNPQHMVLSHLHIYLLPIKCHTQSHAADYRESYFGVSLCVRTRNEKSIKETRLELYITDIALRISIEVEVAMDRQNVVRRTGWAVAHRSNNCREIKNRI